MVRLQTQRRHEEDGVWAGTKKMVCGQVRGRVSTWVYAMISSRKLRAMFHDWEVLSSSLSMIRSVRALEVEPELFLALKLVRATYSLLRIRSIILLRFK